MLTTVGLSNPPSHSAPGPEIAWSLNLTAIIIYRLSIPIVAIVGKQETALAAHAAAAIVLPRAKNEKVAMHGASLVCVEALTLGLATRNRDKTLSVLDRLVELRQQIRPNKR